MPLRTLEADPLLSLGALELSATGGYFGINEDIWAAMVEEGEAIFTHTQDSAGGPRFNHSDPLPELKDVSFGNLSMENSTDDDLAYRPWTARRMVPLFSDSMPDAGSSYEPASPTYMTAHSIITQETYVSAPAGAEGGSPSSRHALKA